MKRHPFSSHSSLQKSRRSSFRPRLESLEDRTLPAQFFPLAAAADGSPGSLRDAISIANTNGEDDAIVLESGSYNLTLAGADEDADATGDFDVTEAGHSVTIVGAGAGSSIIDGHSLDGIIQVFENVSVELSGITLTNGQGSHRGAGGGAVFVGGGTLTVSNCSLINNRAIAFGGGSFGWGGAVFSNSSTVVISDSMVSNNSADFGGAIFVDTGGSGSLQLVSAIVQANTSAEGAVDLRGGTTEIIGSTISGNRNGGIYTRQQLQQLTIAGSAITDNQGSGIFAFAGTLSVSGTTVANNRSEGGGGGIHLVGPSATVIDSTITGNWARFDGGGIDIESGAMTVVSTTISANTTNQIGRGGGIVNLGQLTLTGSTLSGNTNSGGGGLYNSGNATVVNTTFSANWVPNFGGGGAISNQGVLSLINSTVTSNFTGVQGNAGGLQNQAGATLNIQNAIVAGNSADRPSQDVDGAFNSQGHNLIGDGTDSSGFGAPGDQVGTAGSPIDPQLGPLQDNGGSTFTHALLAGSPAIDAGDDAVFPSVTGDYDQRGPGFPRMTDGDGNGTVTIDIGAFELAPPNQPPTADAGGPYTIAEGDSLTLDASASDDPDDDALTYSWDINGDSTFGDATGVSPIFTWSQLRALGIDDGPASLSVQVRVDDGHGHVVDSTATTLTINNTAPTLTLSGSSTVTVGAVYTLNLSSSDPGADTIDHWTINWGDGSLPETVPGNPPSVTHTYSSPDNYTISGSATDEDGTFSANNLDVTVTPPPVVTLTANQDSFLRQGSANTNEGANPRLRIANNGNNRAVVAFDLTGVSLVGLTRATLVLTIAENADNWGSSGRTVDVHRLLVNWAEGNGINSDLVDGPGPQQQRGTGAGVTWNCAIDTDIANHDDDCGTLWDGGTFAPATAAPVVHTNGLLGPVSWDVTQDVLSGASYGWVIRKTLENQNGKVHYSSREGALDAGDPDLAPRLILEYGGSPLRAAKRPGRHAAAALPLTAGALQPILNEAIHRWQARGLSETQMDQLRGVEVRIADLGGDLLGLAQAHTIYLDDNAAGHGWFADSTPSDDSEFQTRGNQGERRGMDLLTVLMHEFGHVLGLGHDQHGLMNDTLLAGQRNASIDNPPSTEMGSLSSEALEQTLSKPSRIRRSQ